MAASGIQRRLVAILAADVVGYSRLIGLDEAGTLAALKAHQRELINQRIADNGGRMVKLTGDGMLAEFASVIHAVTCATEIQAGMARRNVAVAPDRRIELRIGVNLGDIVVEDDDIFGDGVNVAARLESIAEPGAVFVSASVRDEIGNRLKLDFQDVGERQLKNIERPVRVFRVVDEAPEGAPAAVRQPPQTSLPKPSIAVLPFLNMSGDAEQDYFADGMTEDLITDLSKVSGLSVIARNSVFALKNAATDVREVGRRLGVTTVLEGSVRRAGSRVRINAQLVACGDGTHLWADRYDRDLTDIFTLQDEITRTIVGQLRVRLLPSEERAIEAWPTSDVDAYTFYLRGRHLYHLHSTKHALLARKMFQEAVELDQDYARAYSGLADCAWLLVTNHYESVDSGEIMSASLTALRLDPSLAEAHASHAIALHFAGRREDAVVEFERAIELDPTCFEAFLLYGYACRDSEKPERAAELYKRAAELDPGDYRTAMLHAVMLKDVGRMAEHNAVAFESIERAEKALADHPDIALPAALGSAVLAAMADRRRALEWADRAMAIGPDDPITRYNVACTFAIIGEDERALDMLEQWAAHSNTATARWLLTDTDFDGLRGNPRFLKLLSQG